MSVARSVCMSVNLSVNIYYAMMTNSSTFVQPISQPHLGHTWARLGSMGMPDLAHACDAYQHY